jgi:hypothetical protein
MTVPEDCPICVLSYGREKVRSHSAAYLGNIAAFGSFTHFSPILKKSDFDIWRLHIQNILGYK